MSRSRRHASVVLVLALTAGARRTAAQGPYGLAVPGTTSYPHGGMRRVGKIKLSSSSFRSLYNAVYDPVHGFAYFTTADSINPGRVVAVDVKGAQPLEVPGGNAQTAMNEFPLLCGVVDPAKGVALFGTLQSPAHIAKFSLDAVTGVPTYVGATPLSAGPPSENSAFGAVIDASAADPSVHAAYFVTLTSPGNVVKVGLGTNPSDLPARLTGSPFPMGQNAPRRGAIDTANGYAYFANIDQANPLFIKVKLDSGGGVPASVGIAPLAASEANIGSVVLDASKSYALLGIYNPSVVPTSVVKVRLNAGDTPPSRVSALPLGAGERELSTGVVDTASGTALFGSDHTHPARIYKIRFEAGDAPPTEVGSLQLDPGNLPYPVMDGGNISSADADAYGEIYLQSSVYDAPTGYAYFGTDTVPGQVVKVAVSHKGAIKGTRVVVPAMTQIGDVAFYAHAASGNVRLSVYDDASPKNLLWQSSATPATAGWVDVPVFAGAPASLTLAAGTYWLTWQVDTTLDVPSYTAGVSGDGFLFEQPFGVFPSTLALVTATSERYSIALNFSCAADASAPVATAPSAAAFTQTLCN